MNSSRRKLASILEKLGNTPSARRSAATPASPSCESLEGRQLLAGDMGLGLAGIGLNLGIADVSVMGGGSGAIGAPGTAMAGIVGRGVTGSSTGAVADTQLQADLSKVQADTQAIQDGSLVTPTMTSAVNADIAAIKSAETTPANPALSWFVQAATKSIDSTPGGPTLGQIFQLETVQNVLYLNEGATTTLVNQLDADEMAVMAATGITAADEATLAADQAAITADQAAAKPVTGTTTPTTGTTTLLPGMTPSVGSTTATPVSGSFGSGGMGSQGEIAAAGASVLLSSPTGVTSLSGIGADSTWDMTPPVASSAAAATLQADQTTMQTDMQTLQSVVKLVQTTSSVTPAMEAVVRTDLAAVNGATSATPNAADVATLKADYTTAMTNSGGPTATQLAQIQSDAAAVYESQGVGATLVSKLQSAQAAVLSASAVTDAEIGTLYADQQTVQADQTKVKVDVAALPPTTTTTTTTTPATAASALGMPGGDLGGFGPGDHGFPG